MKNSSKESVFTELLILQIKSGDKRAFQLLFERWNKDLWIHARRILKDSDLAKDAVQIAWISINKNLGRLREPQYFGLWAKRIVYFKAIDLLREEEKRNSNKVTEDAVTESDPRLERVMMGMKMLTPDHQLILKLHYLEEMQIAEIAVVLDLPPGTVKSRLYHARNKLKETLKIKL